VDAGQAMLYDANGLFTASARRSPRRTARRSLAEKQPYLPVAAVQKTTDNYLTVTTDATARRVALKEEIARRPCAQERHHRRGGAEVDRRAHRPVVGAQQHGLRNQPGHSAALVQDIANRNEAQRQTEAKKEQQHAEFTEAVQKYGQTFRLMNAPTAFPTP
jgi:hypothetical protein